MNRADKHWPQSTLVGLAFEEVKQCDGYRFQ
jgi:hypothetical protein